ncbi:MAG: MoaD/ThiS family protein [Promethearchaeota archaeon]
MRLINHFHKIYLGYYPYLFKHLRLERDNMAHIKLQLLNIFRLKINKPFVEYEGKTVGDIIKLFVAEYKNKLDEGLLSKNRKKLHPQIVVLLNGRNVAQKGKLKTKLNDGEELYVSVPITGG